MSPRRGHLPIPRTRVSLRPHEVSAGCVLTTTRCGRPATRSISKSDGGRSRVRRQRDSTDASSICDLFFCLASRGENNRKKENRAAPPWAPCGLITKKHLLVPEGAASPIGTSRCPRRRSMRLTGRRIFGFRNVISFIIGVRALSSSGRSFFPISRAKFGNLLEQLLY